MTALDIGSDTYLSDKDPRPLEIECELCHATIHVPVHTCEPVQIDSQRHVVTFTVDHAYLAHHLEMHRQQ